ncbi:MAG: hypothetical protein Q8904_01020 [Bacteroidota bacterium]|nr:hypothetical protein [Bacteroidota bacterium]
MKTQERRNNSCSMMPWKWEYDNGPFQTPHPINPVKPGSAFATKTIRKLISCWF